MSVERYLNHPTFGMLYRVCPLSDSEEIYATLYAQRMFFRVSLQPQGTAFEAMPFSDARHQAEQNLLRQRRSQSAELPLWKKLFDQTFIWAVSNLAQRYQKLTDALPQSVKLLAVSKGQPAAAIRELYELGQRSFGESRLQEASAKQQELADLANIDWQFIGRLQANKVRAVLKGFSTIHAVDSLALAQRISRIASELGRHPQLYLQLKLRHDPNKGGLLWPEALELWPQLRSLPALKWQGVMIIPPRELQTDALAEVFSEAVAHAQSLGLQGCSMGMSGDWRLAAEQGSTVVRVGSALFGSV